MEYNIFKKDLLIAVRSLNLYNGLKGKGGRL